MSSWIMNAMTGDQCVLSEHAIRRWQELVSIDVETPLRERLKRAIPYGGQNGAGQFLIDGDVVFVTKRRAKSDIRDVTTVLPKEYAIANMQAGHRHRHGADPVVTTRPQTDDIMMILQEVKAVGTKTDYELAERYLEVVVIRGQVLDNLRRKALGRLMNAIEGEQGRRKAVVKYRAHANLMELQYRAVKQALCELVAEENRLAIYARAKEIEDQWKASTATPVVKEAEQVA